MAKTVEELFEEIDKLNKARTDWRAWLPQSARDVLLGRDRRGERVLWMQRTSSGELELFEGVIVGDGGYRQAVAKSMDAGRVIIEANNCIELEDILQLYVLGDDGKGHQRALEALGRDNVRTLPPRRARARGALVQPVVGLDDASLYSQLDPDALRAQRLAHLENESGHVALAGDLPVRDLGMIRLHVQSAPLYIRVDTITEVKLDVFDYQGSARSTVCTDNGLATCSHEVDEPINIVLELMLQAREHLRVKGLRLP